MIMFNPVFEGIFWVLVEIKTLYDTEGVSISHMAGVRRCFAMSHVFGGPTVRWWRAMNLKDSFQD